MLGSKLFSYLADASVRNPNLVAVLLIDAALKQALSKKTLVVSFKISLSSPPITPAIPKYLFPFLIINISLVSFLVSPSKVVYVSPSFAVPTSIFLTTLASKACIGCPISIIK